MIGLRMLVLEDTRLALVLRVQMAPTSAYVAFLCTHVCLSVRVVGCGCLYACVRACVRMHVFGCGGVWMCACALAVTYVLRLIHVHCLRFTREHPPHSYLNHRPGQHTSKALGPSSCPASMLGQQPLPHRAWQGSPSMLPLALHLHAGLARAMWQPQQDVKEEAPPAQSSAPLPPPTSAWGQQRGGTKEEAALSLLQRPPQPAAPPGPFSPASERQSETSTWLWGLHPPSPFDAGVDLMKGEDPGPSSSSSNA